MNISKTNRNEMDNQYISTNSVLSRQTSPKNAPQHIQLTLDQSNRQNVTNNVNIFKKPAKLPRNRLDKPCCIKHRLSIRVCAFVSFTYIAMAVGIITVYFTLAIHAKKSCQLTFRKTAERTIGYDSRPHQVAVGNFNKDKYFDLVVVNPGTNCVAILLGFGNGTFAPQIAYSTGLGSRPYSVAVADFNNDTRLDIVVANYATNSIGVFLGYGNGSFGNQIITSLGSSRPVSLAVGDFNNDSLLDIAVANYGTSNVVLLLGSNNGYFRTDKIYDMGYDSIPYSLAVGDFNQDQRLDIATVNYGTSELVIVLRNENESFATHKYSTGYASHPVSIAVNDFNNDHLLDIAVVNSDSSNIGLFLGNRNGTFRNLMTYTTGPDSRPQSFAVSDLNNDTQLDIVVVESENNKLLVLKGDGNGNFIIITRYSTGYNSNPSSVAVADFDNDHKPEVVISNYNTNNLLILTKFTVYPNASQKTYATGENSYTQSVAVGDFNNDHHPDIAVANTDNNNICVFINLGDGTFDDQITYSFPMGNTPNFVTVADVNNDKELDIIISMLSRSKVQILLGYGNGTFRFGNTYVIGEGAGPRWITVADLNNDTHLDMVVANYRGHYLSILLGRGDGTFTNDIPNVTATEFSSTSVAVGDINKDEILDIIATNRYAGGIYIFLGYGNGSFSAPLTLSTNEDQPFRLALGDLNNDHRLDIVYTSPDYSLIGILLGDDNGTFGKITRYSTGSGSQSDFATIGDINNDTLLDIAVANTQIDEIGLFFGYGNGSFAAQKTFSTGYDSLPSFIAWTAFNNDKLPDIVVSNPGGNNIIVFLLHYPIDFADETSYFLGSGPHPYSVAIADFNKDDLVDIVVANSGNDNIQLLRNYNKGTFMSNMTYSSGFGSYPQFVTVADFNRDNQLDIAVVNNRNGTISVFLGSRNETFDPAIIYSTGSDSFPTSIAVGDFNKDKWMDIVVANSGTDNLSVFLGFNYATFTTETIEISGVASSPYYVVASDFNNDHYCDIIVTNLNVNSVNVYLGYGNGTFAEQMSFSIGDDSQLCSIAVGDFNSDNYLDIVIAKRKNATIDIFLGYGNGSFATQITYSTGHESEPFSVAAGDFNQDNILDIVVANSYTNNTGVFIGYGNGTFQEQLSYWMPDQFSPLRIAVNDLNNDNILDIAVTNAVPYSIGILFGYGNGSFGDMIILATGDYIGPSAIAIGNLNNDSWMDIAVANWNEISIFFGCGNGTFSSEKTYSTGSQSISISIIINDLNGDTIPDIAIADQNNGYGYIGVLYGYGDGNFTLLKTYSTGLDSDPLSIAIGDFNNDDRVDLAITYYMANSIGIMLRHKSEPFALPAIYSTNDSSHPKSVATGDFNNDNQLDIAVANFDTNNIGILLGYENGTFAQQQTYSTGENSGPISISVSDFNNDNHFDIAVANSKANTIVIFRGYGNGIFSILAVYFTGISSNPSSIAVNNLNKDNHSDIVVSNFGSNDVLVFYGRGDGTFLEPNSYSLGFNTRPQSVAIGDINHDNLLDIVVANYGGDYVEVLLQTC